MRAYTGQPIPQAGENAYLVGPFSPEMSIDVPALNASPGIILAPDVTAQIPTLIMPTPKPLSTIKRTTLKLVTPEPTPRRIVTRNPFTPAPTVLRQIIRIPVITPTPAPTVQNILPLDPVIPLAPI